MSTQQVDPLEAYTLAVDDAFDEVCVAVGRNSQDFDDDDYYAPDAMCRLAVELADSGVGRIARERFRQQEQEKFDEDHDDAHKDSELALAAASYAIPYALQEKVGDGRGRTWPRLWPWDPDSWKPDYNRIRELEKAGALIAAEIDRLLRHQEV